MHSTSPNLRNMEPDHGHRFADTGLYWMDYGQHTIVYAEWTNIHTYCSAGCLFASVYQLDFCFASWTFTHTSCNDSLPNIWHWATDYRLEAIWNSRPRLAIQRNFFGTWTRHLPSERLLLLHTSYCTILMEQARAFTPKVSRGSKFKETLAEQ